jgi:hypothetical protein
MPPLGIGSSMNGSGSKSFCSTLDALVQEANTQKIPQQEKVHYQKKQKIWPKNILGGKQFQGFCLCVLSLRAV